MASLVIFLVEKYQTRDRQCQPALNLFQLKTVDNTNQMLIEIIKSLSNPINKNKSDLQD